MMTQMINPGSVPEMVWRDWPILAVLATIVFAQFGLLSFVVLRFASKIEKMADSVLQLAGELKVLAALVAKRED